MSSGVSFGQLTCRSGRAGSGQTKARAAGEGDGPGGGVGVTTATGLEILEPQAAARARTAARLVRRDRVRLRIMAGPLSLDVRIARLILRDEPAGRVLSAGPARDFGGRLPGLRGELGSRGALRQDHGYS